jgi:hypothetical protein
MLNRPAAAASILLALTACASAPPAPDAKSTAVAHTPASVNCVATPTGLLAPPRDCAVFGHTWTQNDIDRTGAATTAGALRLLDPTITVTGH